MKIYLASSWRNLHYPKVLQQLRDTGHEVYDFRENGFNWGEIAPGFAEFPNDKWSFQMVASEKAREHFARDKAALDACDMLVLLHPCGRSAHLEAGYAIGKGKPVHIILGPEHVEPELMYLLADHIQIATDLE